MGRYRDQTDETKARARAMYREAYPADGMTDEDIDHEIVAGPLYCPYCGRWDCEMECESCEENYD